MIIKTLYLYIVGAVLAVLLGAVGLQSWRLHEAQVDLGKVENRAVAAEADLKTMGIRLADQKKAAGELLATRTAERDNTEKALGEIYEQRERDNARNKAALAARNADLQRALAERQRLLNAAQATAVAGRGSSSGSAASAPQPTPLVSAANATEAPWVLPAERIRSIAALMADADAVNAAYIDCRDDAVQLRRMLAINASPAAAGASP